MRDFTPDEINFLDEAIWEAEKEYFAMMEAHIEEIAKDLGEA